MSALTQMTLDLELTQEPSLQNFLPGQNLEPLQALHGLLQGDSDYLSMGQLLLFGPPGCGKSHLMQAAQGVVRQRLGTAYMCSAQQPPMYWPDEEELEQGVALFAVDDCQLLDAANQARLFALYNVARQNSVPMLFTANAAAQHLPLRDDLRTRLAWGLAFELLPLSDEQTLAVLQTRALERGFVLQRELAEYLLRHHSRDLRSLTLLLSQLDHFALVMQRPVTLPLYRQWLASHTENL